MRTRQHKILCLSAAEEILHSNVAHWWSKDGTYILYARFDDTNVPTYRFPNYGPGEAIYGYVDEIAYPKVRNTSDLWSSESEHCIISNFTFASLALITISDDVSAGRRPAGKHQPSVLTAHHDVATAGHVAETDPPAQRDAGQVRRAFITYTVYHCSLRRITCLCLELCKGKRTHKHLRHRVQMSLINNAVAPLR